MQINGLDIIAPGLYETDRNEAEMLGSAVWLWMHSSGHRDAPLRALVTDLLPAIKHKQFVLLTEGDKPVSFVSWANLSEQAEQRYIRHTSTFIPEEDWNSGDRIWILDWITPFGHSQRTSSLLARTVFQNRCGRSLYHRGNDKGLRVMNFHGIAVMPEEARFWFHTHPVDIPHK